MRFAPLDPGPKQPPGPLRLPVSPSPSVVSTATAGVLAWIHAIRASYGPVTHQPDDGPVADLGTEQGETGTPIPPWVMIAAILAVVAVLVVVAWR